MACQLAAICGQRQFPQRPRFQMTGHRAEKAHDVAPHQRLAPCDAQLGHAKADEGGTEAIKLFKGQQILARQELHPLCHAIAAAKIAAVRDRHAQITHRPTEPIHQRATDRLGRGAKIRRGVQHCTALRQARAERRMVKPIKGRNIGWAVMGRVFQRGICGRIRPAADSSCHFLASEAFAIRKSMIIAASASSRPARGNIEGVIAFHCSWVKALTSRGPWQTVQRS